MSTITMKFGGTSMGSHDAIAQVARIITDQAKQGDRILTVVSAMSGVTDMLLQAANTSSEGDESSHFAIVEELRKRHHETVDQLVHYDKIKQALVDDLDGLLEGLNALCHSLAV